MTNYTLSKMGHYIWSEVACNGDWKNGEPRIRLTEAYQKTDKLDGSLLEI